ncbi:MAG: hypothetical protein PF442_07595 [Desulfobulbaceae bacterium]|jgi:hypothetical protein|nr:hypothetical protein [Desulfobulbaceae bacterium]
MQPFNLKEKIPQEEFDYQTLSGVLAAYTAPRDKITSLIKQGVIIRVKKGIYVFGKAWRRHPYSLETLANLIYGPSYISLEYALQFYGLIPEQVRTVTSVTTGRSRRFSTPVGDFSYWKIPMTAFASGMDLWQNAAGGAYLIAVPEKALTDKIQSERGLPIRSREDVERYLVENLRMDIDDLSPLSAKRIEEYAVLYRSQKARSLAAFIRYIATPSR